MPNSPGAASMCDTDAAPRLVPSLLLPRRQLLASIEALLGDTPLTLEDLPADTRTSNFIQAEVQRASADGVRQLSTAAQSAAAFAVENHLETLLPCALESFDPTCQNAFVDSFLTDAFRRPATSEEVSRFEAFLSAQSELLGPERGVALFIEAVLQSPSFLYRFEEAEETAPEDGLVPLSAHSLAARLSYFLTGAPPDAELAQSAADGSLTDPAELERQTRRLLAQPGAAGMTLFFEELLHLDFELITKNSELLDGAAPQETLAHGWDEMFSGLIRSVMADGGSLNDLLTTPHLEVPADLQSVYSTSAPRSGLLTQPGLLAALAHDHSSPVLRGVYVRDHLLCDPVPPPPAGVEANIPDGAATNTTRERYAQLEDDPSCRSCHSLIHSIGFAFEEFDALGRYRTDEEGFPIDPSGSFVGFNDSALTGDFSGVAELGGRMAQSEQFIGCMTRRLYEAAAVRGLDGNDECALDGLTSATMGDAPGANLQDMIVALVNSPRFVSQSASTEIDQ